MTKFSSKTFLRSTTYALNGLRLAFKSQRNFRKHLVIALFAVLIGLFLRLDIISMCIIILVNVIVLICELFNSIIEFIMDAYYRNKWAKLAKLAKDMGAGTVFLASVTALGISILLYLNGIYELWL
jgi:diacylglycerol kinase